MSTQRFIVKSAADLGRTITEARALTGLSQTDLADRTGLDRSYLSRMEGGLETVHLTRILATLRSLGVRLEATLDHDNG
jgi:HTH-type transcriptional regulator/antitoxin HipB